MTATPGEIAAILTGVAVVIAQVGTTFVLIMKAQQDAREARESRSQMQEHLNVQDGKLVALHESTNGLSKRAEELAGLLGEAKGKAQEKANPS
jgi:hypothetical protein